MGTSPWHLSNLTYIISSLDKAARFWIGARRVEAGPKQLGALDSGCVPISLADFGHFETWYRSHWYITANYQHGT